MSESILPYDKQIAVLNLLILNGSTETALEKIKEWKLPFVIENGKLVDTTDKVGRWLDKYITGDPVMLQVKQDIRKLAKERDEVLITGPTGTGKELLAHALHGDRDGQFMAINCAGLPDNLIESELFGHDRGAFTGASETTNGLFKIAAGGTVFLDEISELPIQLQGKLLRVLQEKKVRRVGGKKEEDITCRIVAATNRDLEEMCEEKKFRLDLYARISIIELETTPLTSRLGDVELITKSLPGGDKLWAELTKDPDFTPSDLDLLLNVRALQKYVRQYTLLGRLPRRVKQ